MFTKTPRVRFTKRNVKKQHYYPSSLDSNGIDFVGKGFLSKCLRLFRRFCIYSVLIVSLLAILLLVLLKVGISGNFIAQNMQVALHNKLVNIAQTNISNASLAFSEDYYLTVESRNIVLSNIKGGIGIDKVGLLRLGISGSHLIYGDIKVAQLEIADSVVDIPSFKDEGFFQNFPQTSHGHIDFDETIFSLFKVFDECFSILKSQDTRLIIIRNVDFNFNIKGSPKTVHIDKIVLQHQNNSLVLNGNLMFEKQMVALDATIDTATSDFTNKFIFSVKNLPYHIGKNDPLERVFADGRPNDGYFYTQGVMNIALKGGLTRDNHAQVNLTVTSSEGTTDMAQYNDIATQSEINLAYQSGNNQVTLLPSKFIFGSLYVPFKGDLQPVLDSHEQSVYGFNIILDNGEVQPRDLELPRLGFTGKVIGLLMAKRSLVDFTSLSLQLKHSKLEGRGDLQFGSQSPQIRFEFNTPDISLKDAKQLWPINIALQARSWVVNHLIDGRLQNANFKINLPAGIFKAGEELPLLTENEVRIDGNFENVSSHLIDDLPVLRKGRGRFTVKGTETEVFVDHGVAYLDKQKDSIELNDGYVNIPWQPKIEVYGDISANLKGKISDGIKLVSLDPINAKDYLPLKANEISGNVSSSFKLRFPLKSHPDKTLIDWSTEMSFDQLSLMKPLDGRIRVSNAKGTASLNKKSIKVIADAMLNDIPANIEFVRPMEDSNAQSNEKIRIQLTDDVRAKLIPGLNGIVSGTVLVEIGTSVQGVRPVTADITNAEIRLPWVGWVKGKGIAGKVQFSFKHKNNQDNTIQINNFSLKGDSYNIAGNMLVQNGTLQSADFTNVNLNRDDSVEMTIRKDTGGYYIVVNSKSFDARALVKMLSGQQSLLQSPSPINENLDLVVGIDHLTGFYGALLKNVKLKMVRKGQVSEQVVFSALTVDNKSINAKMERQNNMRNIEVFGANAGVLLRFIDLYDKVRGGILYIALRSGPDGNLTGPVRINKFEIVNEPRLVSLVVSKPQNGGKSLHQAVKGKIDVSVAAIDTASAFLNKGDSFFVLDDGIVRGQTIGATFQGIIYDSRGNISMTGTFMPAYSINRVFGEVPILGEILGNGRDRGLFGVTFKVDGKTRDPKVTINPISAIAPGVFRQIFKYQQ